MTQALNYTTKAIDDLMRFAKKVPPTSRKGVHFIIDLLRRAEVFVLPDRGALLDRDKPYPEVPASILRPSFPVVALEYQWSNEPDWQPTSFYNAVSCSRRIALVWEFDGSTPGGKEVSDLEPGGAFAVASIVYNDAHKMWAPVMAAVVTKYDTGYVMSDNHSLIDALVRDGRMNAKQKASRVLETRHIMAIMPDLLADIASKYGMEMMLNSISADIMDEFNAYRDLSLALACSNVSAERIAQPSALNRSRIRSGKAPLKNYHVLKIAGRDGAGEEPFGGSAGVRSHLRRGHVRRIGGERITWVNATMVRGARPGFVDKHYQINT